MSINAAPSAADPSALNLSDVFKDAFNCGVIVVGRDGQVLARNDEAQRLLNLAVWQAPDGSTDILPPGIREIVTESFTSNQGIRNRGIALCGASGPTVGASTLLVPARPPAVGFLILLMHDFSPFSSIEWRMLRLNRLASVGMLSAGMAHEIKNALVSIKTFVDSVARGILDGGFSSLVTREIQRINSLVSQMLKFSGTAPTQGFARLGMHALLDQTFRLVEHHVMEKNIQVRRSCLADFDCVLGDAYQLEQAFLNLFLNAVAAMPDGGELGIATAIVPPSALRDCTIPATAAGWLRLTISDTGSGIPPEMMDRIFEPFFTTKQEGTGLGLSIVQRIIHDHHGAIKVESSAGKGASFSIFLPIEK
jgi:signal transduction histidine kinase